jgi:dihydrofolate reductase
MKLILLMAITLDGKTGKDSEHFVDWTEQEDKKFFVRITKKAGVIIMGSKTFDTIGKPLPGRKNIILTRNRQRKSQWDNLDIHGQNTVGASKNLEKEGFSEAVLAGGPTINTLFARERLIDEVIVTVSPLDLRIRNLSFFRRNRHGTGIKRCPKKRQRTWWQSLTTSKIPW